MLLSYVEYMAKPTFFENFKKKKFPVISAELFLCFGDLETTNLATYLNLTQYFSTSDAKAYRKVLRNKVMLAHIEIN